MKELQLGPAIGYLINAKKQVHKAILIKCEDEFYIISAAYKKGEMSVYRNSNRMAVFLKTIFTKP